MNSGYIFARVFFLSMDSSSEDASISCSSQAGLLLLHTEEESSKQVSSDARDMFGEVDLVCFWNRLIRNVGDFSGCGWLAGSMSTNVECSGWIEHFASCSIRASSRGFFGISVRMRVSSGCISAVVSVVNGDFGRVGFNTLVSLVSSSTKDTIKLNKRISNKSL